MHLEIGEFAGASLYLPPHGFQGTNSGQQTWHLYPLGHPTDPSLTFLIYIIAF